MSDSTIAVTSVADRAVRPPVHVGHGPVYDAADAVAALIRSFIGHGQSGSLVPQRLQRLAPGPVVVQGSATLEADVPTETLRMVH